MQNLTKILLLIFPVFFYGQNLENLKYEILQIPTVFHIVNSKELSRNDKLQIENQIKYLMFSVNDRMKIIDKDKLQNGFGAIAANPKIELLLPKCDIENNKINPISWHKVPSYYFRDFLPFIDDISLNQFGVLDKNHFLNIWIINVTDSEEANLAGYVPNKLLNDGIVLDLKDFKSMLEDPFIVIHELGHYLGLKHIWGISGVSSKFHNCKDDDGIEDTPKQKKPHVVNNFDFVQNSCDGTGKTNHQNFMDYSYDTGMFTEDQVEVMRNNLKTKRAGLLWKPNCKEFSESVLSQTKQREKFGTRMIVNNLYPYGTITDRDMVELFNSIGIIPTKEKLEQLGLKIIANNKFEDLATGEFVDQHQIYERLDLEKVKVVANETTQTSLRDEVEQTFILTSPIGFINPNYYSRRLVLISKANSKEYEINVQKAGYNNGDKKTTWTQIPLGVYTCNVYTNFSKKLIRSFIINFSAENQTIELFKNGYN